jgi:hypothetical protein
MFWITIVTYIPNTDFLLHGLNESFLPNIFSSNRYDHAIATNEVCTQRRKIFYMINLEKKKNAKNRFSR